MNMMSLPKAGFAGEDLRDAWLQLRLEQPRLRIRDAAALLNVSEAELLYASRSDAVVRLRPDWRELFDALPAFGRLMALTRNEHCVHERYGEYDNIRFSANGLMGLVVNGAIDLRLFTAGWTSLFAVTDALKDSTQRRSLQIFNRQGVAVHKIYLTDESDDASWQPLLGRMALDAAEIDEPLVIDPFVTEAAPRPDEEVDAQALRTDWAALKDTHHFHAMLRRHDVARLQALRLAGPEFAEPLSRECIQLTFEQAAARQLEIMVFTGNSGCIQIHSGPVRRVARIGDWYNVLDPDFNLHLRDSAVAELWRVRKPTADGLVCSLEAYDSAGELIVQLFGVRKPGQAESAAWRSLVESHVAA